MDEILEVRETLEPVSMNKDKNPSRHMYRALSALVLASVITFFFALGGAVSAFAGIAASLRPTLPGDYVFMQTLTSGNSSFGITGEGKLFAWGDNTNGRLGLGDSLHRNNPQEILPHTYFRRIMQGTDLNQHFAFTEDSRLFAWGLNTNGRLGVGDFYNRNRPTEVLPGTQFSTLRVQGNSVYALTTDGRMIVWGHNPSGRLGIGNTLDRTIPTRILPDTLFNSIYSPTVSITDRTVHAIGRFGEFWGWGHNNNGQVGNGNRADQSSPVQINPAQTWVSVYSIAGATFAIQTNRQLFAWGLNTSGRLGIGNADAAHVQQIPARVGTLTNVATVSVSADPSSVLADTVLAYLENNHLWGWGRNTEGQLGDGTTTNRHTPIRI